MSKIIIDNDAKLRIDMFCQQDSDENDFFIGKLQFPGTLDFDEGISFMLFTSKQDNEELQIGPIDISKTSNRKKIRGTKSSFGRTSIDMHWFEDSNGNKVYVGEALCPTRIKCNEGIFFAAFISRDGNEELQISRLDHSKSKKLQKLASERHTNSGDVLLIAKEDIGKDL